ncbi:PX-domain-containing protein [Lenzites betulinus]|nr:PX-domain-containing protein [Lenzites betulinus]
MADTASSLEFDSGINTSAAWTLASPEGGARLSLNSIHTESGKGKIAIAEDVTEEEEEPAPTPEQDGGDSVAEDDVGDDEDGRPARALYAFQGKAEFRELTHIEAGDELEIMREDVGEGWSLARLARGSHEGGPESEMGLIPRSYYIFTAEFAQTEGLLVPSTHSRIRSRREASGDSITPRGSPVRGTEALPIVPQTTGEWFPSFRRSLLGGKSLNRFSSFVTSGAEEFVLQGSSADPTAQESHPIHQHSRSVTDDDMKRESVIGHIAEAERHFVEAGPSWKTKVPPFRVLVHSPSKRASMLTGAYTMYTVTTSFDALAHSRSASDPDNDNDDEDDASPPSPMRITVHRRFSHFVALHTALTRLLPGIALPPLPEKQYAGRFSDDFVEARRGDLERYINRVTRHPVARYAEVLTFFLGCESDAEWKKQLPYYLALPPKGPAFYANVYHPAFNVDAEEASDAVDRFVNHTRVVGKGIQSLRNIFGRVREARMEMSKAERLLSYTLQSLITAKPLASAPTTGIDDDDEEDQDHSTRGHLNAEGAWCWRENCDSCLKLTKAMQKTSETLQIVADLYDSHARRTQLATHEAFKNVAHPSALYAPVIDTHTSTLSRYQDSVREGAEDEDMAARCETVLNITMAEMDTYHTQKVEDFQELAKEHLDGEIAFYEQILTRLRTARRTFDPPQYDELARTGPRQPSIYERELEHPRLNPPPLPQPCPHVFDSAPMRPVSVAIQEGVGMLLGGVTSPARGSVFGKFW